MIQRKMIVTMKENGNLLVTLGNMQGILLRESKGWVWNIFEDEFKQQATAFGSNEQQYAAYGELICKMFELST